MLSLSHLRLQLVPERELQLPAYNKGNSLRGGFGAAFRKLVCVDLNWECADCSLRYTCPYTAVFNPFWGHLLMRASSQTCLWSR